MKHPDLSGVLDEGDWLVVVDGGARNGPKNLVGLDHLSRFYCFEPNPAEIDSFHWVVSDSISADKGKITLYPFALCDTSGSTTLNISLRPGATSTLEPDPAVLDRFEMDYFSEMKEIVRRIEVPAITLQDFINKTQLPHVDFLKLDTQGNELDILRSAGRNLESISVIMTEVELMPLYRNQALFHDVSAFLYQHGFEMIDLRHTPGCRRYHARHDLPPEAYRLVWGDAVYAYRPGDVSKARALQQGAVLAGLGYADLAIDIFDRHPRLLPAQKSLLEQYARWAAEPQWRIGKWKRWIERKLGLIIHRYNWRVGQRVRSMKTP